MKKMFFVFLFFSALVPAAFAESYQVNPEASSVEWNAAKVTGTHNGTLNVKSGQIDFENGVLTGGQAVMDMSSIVVLDITNPTYNQKLQNHLNSEDFFDTANFPEANLVITSVESSGEGAYEVTGDFTIKGITHSVTFPAVVTQDEEGVTASAEITIDRTDFNVRYGSGKFFEDLGDKMIYDEFTLMVDVSASK